MKRAAHVGKALARIKLRLRPSRADTPQDAPRYRDAKPAGHLVCQQVGLVVAPLALPALVERNAYNRIERYRAELFTHALSKEPTEVNGHSRMPLILKGVQRGNRAKTEAHGRARQRKGRMVAPTPATDEGVVHFAVHGVTALLTVGRPYPVETSRALPAEAAGLPDHAATAHHTEAWVDKVQKVAPNRPHDD